MYEFRCGACEERFEKLVAAGTGSARCPACGAERTTRVLSAPAAPMGIVKTPAQTRRQERRNAQLRERTKTDFKARRKRARESGGGPGGGS